MSTIAIEDKKLKRKKKVASDVSPLKKVKVEEDEAETATTTETTEGVVVAEVAVKDEPKKERKSTIAKQSESHMHHVIKIKQVYGAALIEQCLDWLRYDATKAIPENFEFEIRLGRYNPVRRAFVSGVAKKFFQQALTAIQKQHLELEVPCWSPEEPELTALQFDGMGRNHWDDEMVYYHQNQIRGIKNSKSKDVRFERSNRILKKDLVQETHYLHDLRFNIKNEQPIVDEEEIAELSERLPQSVRFKSRQSYKFLSRGFKIDFTIAWQARSETQLKRLQESGDLASLEKHRTYEIEVEILKDRLDIIHSHRLFQSVLALLGYEGHSVCPLMPLLEYRYEPSDAVV